MSAPSPIADILNKAADLIETKGWTQNTYVRDQHGAALILDDVLIGRQEAACFCAVGAISVAAGARYVSAYTRALAQTLHANHVPAWNDAPGRTKEEVVAALRAAAKEAA